MRGKTRIGAGLAIYGLALTAWLGIAALPTLQVPFWELLPIGLAVLATAILVWGLVVHQVDSQRAMKAKEKDSSLRRKELEASIASLKAGIATHEYWRSVAAMYDDRPRVQQIDATLQGLRADLARAESDLGRLNR